MVAHACNLAPSRQGGQSEDQGQHWLHAEFGIQKEERKGEAGWGKEKNERKEGGKEDKKEEREGRRERRKEGWKERERE